MKNMNEMSREEKREIKKQLEKNTERVIEAYKHSTTPAEAIETEKTGNVCEGCKYYQAYGDVFRSEPCEGFVTAPDFGSGHDLLKAEVSEKARDLMCALNAVFCFDFCKPYHVTQINGSYTENKIRKAVEEVAPLYAVNRHGFKVVALCSVESPLYLSGRLYAVEITPGGFDVERARSVNQSRFSCSNSFGYCYKKGQFHELRKAESARCIIVIQAAEYLRPAPKMRAQRDADLLKRGERYDLERVNTFVYTFGGEEYISGVEMRTRTTSGELIRYEINRQWRKDAIPADDVGAIIDKSGYLTFERREDLMKRADQARAKKKRAEYESEAVQRQEAERINALFAEIIRKRDTLAEKLTEARTAEELTAVCESLDKWSGLPSIWADFDRYREKVRAQNFPSVEASNKAYERITERLAVI